MAHFAMMDPPRETIPVTVLRLNEYNATTRLHEWLK
jgi:hypothetical protein